MKCRVIEEFTLKDFDKIKITKRKMLDTYGRLYVDDEFECSREMAKYLIGGNSQNKVVVKIIEVPVEENIIPLDQESVKELGNEISKALKTETRPIKPKKKVEKKQDL